MKLSFKEWISKFTQKATHQTEEATATSDSVPALLEMVDPRRSRSGGAQLSLGDYKPSKLESAFSCDD
jgi:hypothetical protein